MAKVTSIQLTEEQVKVLREALASYKKELESESESHPKALVVHTLQGKLAECPWE